MNFLNILQIHNFLSISIDPWIEQLDYQSYWDKGIDIVLQYWYFFIFTFNMTVQIILSSCCRDLKNFNNNKTLHKYNFEF